jgi:hypothetical protein
MHYIFCLNNKYFKIEIEDKEFLKYLESKKAQDFETECVNEKDLMTLYIKKSLELYEKEKKISFLLKKIEVDLSKN